MIVLIFLIINVFIIVGYAFYPTMIILCSYYDLSFR
jgi:hypothetical protein